MDKVLNYLKDDSFSKKVPDNSNELPDSRTFTLTLNSETITTSMFMHLVDVDPAFSTLGIASVEVGSGEITKVEVTIGIV